jgi:hypothetical protein
MIDFPLLPEVASKSAWILGGVMYFSIIFLYYKWALARPISPSDYSKKNGFVFLVFIYCVLAIYTGDWSHLQMAVRESVGTEYMSGFGVERVYHYLANILNGNYLLFRIIVWGTGLFFLLQSFKASNLDPYRCLFFLFGIYITAFAYSRSGAAHAIFYCGFVLLYQEKRPDVFPRRIIGLALIIASVFLHRSMLILVAFVPLTMIPFNRKTSVFILLGAFVLALFWRRLFSGAMEFMVNLEEYAFRIENYEELARSQHLSFDLNGLFYLWYKGIIHVPFWVAIVNLYKLINQGEVPLSVQAIFRISIILYVFIIIMLLTYGSASAFYYRYENMLYIANSIMICYLYQNGHILRRKYSMLFWICALSQCKDFIYRIFFI